MPVELPVCLLCFCTINFFVSMPSHSCLPYWTCAGCTMPSSSLQLIYYTHYYRPDSISLLASVGLVYRFWLTFCLLNYIASSAAFSPYRFCDGCPFMECAMALELSSFLSDFCFCLPIISISTIPSTMSHLLFLLSILLYLCMWISVWSAAISCVLLTSSTM